MEKTFAIDKKKIIIIAAIGVALIIAIILFATGIVGDLLGKWGILKIQPVEPKVTFYEYIPKGDGDVILLDDQLLIADQSGVSCFSVDGTWQWNKEINLKAPVFIPDGEEKTVLGDVGGNGIYGFNEDGLQWNYIIDREIVNISENTVNNQIIIIHDADNYLSAATLVDYSKEVKAIATRKFGQYYMISASMSQNGEQAAIVGITPESEETSTVIAFMDLPGYEFISTKTISNEFLPVASYVNGNNLFLAGGDSLRRVLEDSSYTKQNSVNDLLWGREGGSDTLVAAGNTDGKNFVTVSTVAGAEAGLEASSEVRLYASDGALKESFTCEGGIEAVKHYGKMIALYGENEVFVYNIYGQQIGKFDGVSQISDIEFISEKILVVCGTSKIAKVDFS